MIKAHGKVRSVRTRSLGVECLEGRVVLSGAGHTAAGATAAASVAAEQSALPPTLEESYLLKNGDTVTGLVMVFSKPLDPATSRDVNNYKVEPDIAGIPAETINNVRTETISAAVYNASQDSVTLMMAHPFTLPHHLFPGQNMAFTVTLPQQGSTITDTSGQPLIAGALIEGFDAMSNGLLCNVAVQGPLPNPLVNTYSQSRLNAVVSKLAAAQSIERTNAASPIHLTGTIHGTYSPVTSYENLGLFRVGSTETMTNEAGSISPLGQVTVSFYGSPVLDQKLQNESVDSQQRRFHNKLGTFDVFFTNLQQATSNSLVGNYSIAGGTRAYAGEVGSGHVQVTWTGNRSRGKVTEIYS